MMKKPYLALGILLAFIFAFLEHIAALYYPLAIIIFYVYVPLLYRYWKVGAPKLDDEFELPGSKIYTAAFLGSWALTAIFFSYLLTHLFSDIISGFYHYGSLFRHSHHIAMMAMLFFLVGICYLEMQRRQFNADTDKTKIADNLEKEGRLFSFEVFFFFLIIFLLKH